MTIPLFTHQCGGCRALMELHPALRDLDTPNEPERASRTGSLAAEPPRRRRRTVHPVLAGACIACAVLSIGSLVMI